MSELVEFLQVHLIEEMVEGVEEDVDVFIGGVEVCAQFDVVLVAQVGEEVFVFVGDVFESFDDGVEGAEFSKAGAAELVEVAPAHRCEAVVGGFEVDDAVELVEFCVADEGDAVFGHGEEEEEDSAQECVKAFRVAGDIFDDDAVWSLLNDFKADGFVHECVFDGGEVFWFLDEDFDFVGAFFVKGMEESFGHRTGFVDADADALDGWLGDAFDDEAWPVGIDFELVAFLDVVLAHPFGGKRDHSCRVRDLDDFSSHVCSSWRGIGKHTLRMLIYFCNLRKESFILILLKVLNARNYIGSARDFSMARKNTGK